MSSLILTARFDRAAQRTFDGLRQRYFPPERNLLAAHLTLFHALPSTELEAIQSQLAVLCEQETPMVGVAAKLRSLGRGVAFAVECPRLTAVRHTLAQCWGRHLGRQDSQAFRPHITIQNKVSSSTAKRLLDDLQRTFTPIDFIVEGLDLWAYLGGPRQLIVGIPFSAI